MLFLFHLSSTVNACCLCQTSICFFTTTQPPLSCRQKTLFVCLCALGYLNRWEDVWIRQLSIRTKCLAVKMWPHLSALMLMIPFSLSLCCLCFLGGYVPAPLTPQQGNRYLHPHIPPHTSQSVLRALCNQFSQLTLNHFFKFSSCLLADYLNDCVKLWSWESCSSAADGTATIICIFLNIWDYRWRDYFIY